MTDLSLFILHLFLYKLRKEIKLLIYGVSWLSFDKEISISAIWLEPKGMLPRELIWEGVAPPHTGMKHWQALHKWILWKHFWYDHESVEGR